MTNDKNNMSFCQSQRDNIAGYLREELTASQRERFLAHNLTCPDCAQETDALQNVLHSLTAIDETVPAPDALTDKVLSRILLENDREEVSSRRLTERTMKAVLQLPVAIQAIIPLHWQFLRSTLAACILGTLLIYTVFVPAVAYTGRSYDRDICADNLRTMSALIRHYSVLTPGEESPLQQIEGVLQTIYMNSQDGPLGGAIDLHDLSSCPSSMYSICYASRVLSKEEVESAMPGSVPIVWDKKKNHSKGRNVLFLDGSVLYMDESNFLRMQWLLLKQ